jgi:hypothetical protein
MGTATTSSKNPFTARPTSPIKSGNTTKPKLPKGHFTNVLSEPIRINQETVGVIPRSIQTILESLQTPPVSENDIEGTPTKSSTRPRSFELRASYLELYNEEWVDLLKGYPGGKISTMKGEKEKDTNSNTKDNNVTIREDKDGKLHLIGATEVTISSLQDALTVLETGSRSRTTAATSMNDRSSRSHAIFTLTLTMLHQKRPVSATPSKRPGSAAFGGGLAITSKFHFVDLAGSERVYCTSNEYLIVIN